MSSPPAPGTGSLLDFNSPLSAERAHRLVTQMAAREPVTVIDLGCGWGELLLRLLVALPGAKGVGIEQHAADVSRARANAEARGLEERVTFVEGSAREYAGGADLVLNIGAYQAYGTMVEALAALRELVNPGGRLLFAAEFWEERPSQERLAHMWPGMTVDDCVELPELVELTVAAGFRPLRIERATRGEWEEFESGIVAELEEWALAHPGTPEADELQAKSDELRSLWLRGHRDLMGFAYLTLGVPV
ncbi:methyltransferase domain-containing protein [Streptosporangiaceae bacterium NEAU-GS5]|nr:methyltransferase domain-containing protein [Streptosporangiaceae bacterium NEAU-GS5]